jgi:hypothetical protein
MSPQIGKTHNLGRDAIKCDDIGIVLGNTLGTWKHVDNAL